MGVALCAAVLALIVWASLRAQFDSRCPGCGDQIHEGDLIRLVDGEWLCETCAEDAA